MLELFRVLTPICVLSHNVVVLDAVLFVLGSICNISTSGSLINVAINEWACFVTSGAPLINNKLALINNTHKNKQLFFGGC